MTRATVGPSSGATIQRRIADVKDRPTGATKDATRAPIVPANPLAAIEAGVHGSPLDAPNASAAGSVVHATAAATKADTKEPESVAPRPTAAAPAIRSSSPHVRQPAVATIPTTTGSPATEIAGAPAAPINPSAKKIGNDDAKTEWTDVAAIRRMAACITDRLP